MYAKNFYLRNQSFPFTIKSVVMNGKQIHNYLKGPCGEVFGTYIIVGFRADNGKPLITGNAGHPVDQASQNKFLGEVSNYAQRKIVRYNQDKKKYGKED